MKTVLLVSATKGYQTEAFRLAALDAGIDLRLATDRCFQLDDPWGDSAVAIRFEDVSGSVEALASLPFDGVVAIGDRPTVIAAVVAERRGIPFHPRAAVEVCRDKYASHRALAAAGLPVADFVRLPLGIDPHAAARGQSYPCVLKPLGLSGSRGVIRANDAKEFVAAFARIGRILADPDLRRFADPADSFVQVETFIPGREFALEGLVTEGELQVLAIFDKADALDGPYFEETLYITPSAACPAIVETLEGAIRAVGLTHGPVHAEVRMNERGVYVLETAARPIGGLCAKALTFSGGKSLEELILRHSLQEDVTAWQRDDGASGVMMIPIPASGIYERCDGSENAIKVTGITEVVVTAIRGQQLLRLPEGNSYLGFIFARGARPDFVERSLREAHSRLRFTIKPDYFVLGAMYPGGNAAPSP